MLCRIEELEGKVEELEGTAEKCSTHAVLMGRENQRLHVLQSSKNKSKRTDKYLNTDSRCLTIPEAVKAMEKEEAEKITSAEAVEKRKHDKAKEKVVREVQQKVHKDEAAHRKIEKAIGAGAKKAADIGRMMYPNIVPESGEGRQGRKKKGASLETIVGRRAGKGRFSFTSAGDKHHVTTSDKENDAPTNPPPTHVHFSSDTVTPPSSRRPFGNSQAQMEET
jgi:hypothetical protein